MRTVDDINAHFSGEMAQYAPFVPGEGNPRARLMLIGEAPGAQEVAQGRPFVGTAGKNLDAFLARMRLARESIYITNAVKMRPTRQSAKGRLSNRPPTAQEVKLFQPWLQQELEAVRPDIIATLGNVALGAVAGKGHMIGAVHGKPLLLVGGAVVFPLYHPASIIYRRELESVYAQDIDRLRVFFESLGGSRR